MKQKKINITEGLRNLNKEPLDVEEMNKSKIRLWNVLSSEIQEVEKEIELPKKMTLEDFVRKYEKSFIIAGSSFMIGAIVISAALFSTNYFSTKTNGGDTNVTTTQSESNLKAVAEEKFKSLNGGISYDELKAVTGQTTQTNTANNVPTQPISNLPLPTPINTPTPSVDQQKAKELTQSTDNTQKIYFYQFDIKFASENDAKKQLSKYFGNTFDNLTGVDFTKPFTIENWYSVNYSKFSLSQDTAVLIVELFTPKYHFEYKDGKYAVETDYSDNNYVSSYLNAARQNPEIELIKMILNNDSSLVPAGTDTLNGIKVSILEKSETSVDTKSITKTRYFVDTTNFKLYKVEIYENDNLVSTNNRVTGEEKSVQGNIDSYINYSELRDIPVNKVNYSDIVQTNSYQKVSDFMNKYKIYYISESGKRISYVFDPKAEKINQYNELVNTTNFDPTYKESENNVLAWYLQEDISVSISSKEPVIDVTGNYTAQPKTDIKIFIDGKETNAKRIDLDFTPVTSGVSGQNYSVIYFQDSNNWYAFSLNKNDVPNDKISFTTLTTDKAVDFDNQNDKVNSFDPTLKSINIQQIPENSRYIPGDLSQIVNVKISNVFSTPDNYSDTCVKYFTDKYFVECLIANFNGYRIDFKKISSSESDKYLNYLILPTNSKSVTDFINKYNSNNLSYTIKEYNDVTIVIFSNMIQNDINNVVQSISLKKDEEIKSIIPTTTFTPTSAKAK